MSFREKVHSLLKAKGYKPRDPCELVDWWMEFVSQCVDGYESTIYEYDDEISVREYIETILADRSARDCEEYYEFELQVRDIDKKFAGVLQESKRPGRTDCWWRTGILKYAGEEYRSDIWSRYEIKVAGLD